MPYVESVMLKKRVEIIYVILFLYVNHPLVNYPKFAFKYQVLFNPLINVQVKFERGYLRIYI